MRLLKLSLGAGVLVVAFLITTPSCRAEAPLATVPARPIEAAKTGSPFLAGLATPLQAFNKSAGHSTLTVGIPPHKSVTFPRGTAFRPTPPNIHTRPKKKKSSWWPFSRK